uniref:Uncharacterized protein n=1 Tax=Cacopsylla melanoneura TaxID=428564 RepID=A0A8D8TXR8_9HEMI
MHSKLQSQFLQESVYRQRVSVPCERQSPLVALDIFVGPRPRQRMLCEASRRTSLSSERNPRPTQRRLAQMPCPVPFLKHRSCSVKPILKIRHLRPGRAITQNTLRWPSDSLRHHFHNRLTLGTGLW